MGNGQSAIREHQTLLGTWLQHDVVPLLEDLVAVSYPLRKPALSEPSQLLGEAFQLDDLGKGMV